MCEFALFVCDFAHITQVSLREYLMNTINSSSY